MLVSRLSLTGICCNQQEAWALLGRDSGTCSWFSLSCNSVPGISSLGPVNHGRGDVETGRQTVCNDLIRFLLMSCAHVDRKTHFPIKFLTGTHHRSSLVRTQLLSNVRFLFFPVAFIWYTRNEFWGILISNLLFVWLLKTEAAFYCIHIWGLTLLSL